MTDIVRLLLFPAIAVGAWFVSRRHRGLARKSARTLAGLVAMVLLCVAVAGWSLSGEATAVTHRWAGHALLIVVWLSVPFGVGVSLQRNFRQRPIVAIAQSLGFFALLGAVMLASFTGYLGPTRTAYVDGATYNRFKVLHLFVLPGIIAILTLGWCWAFRPCNDDFTNRGGQDQ